MTARLGVFAWHPGCTAGKQETMMSSLPRSQRSAERVRVLAPTGTRLAVQKVELLLSEKRTALSLLRTGIAVLTLPLSIVTVLVVTSTYCHLGDVLHLALPLLASCVGLAGVGFHLLVRPLRHLRRLDRRIEAIRGAGGPLAELIV